MVLNAKIIRGRSLGGVFIEGGGTLVRRMDFVCVILPGPTNTIFVTGPLLRRLIRSVRLLGGGIHSLSRRNHEVFIKIFPNCFHEWNGARFDLLLRPPICQKAIDNGTCTNSVHRCEGVIQVGEMFLDVSKHKTYVSLVRIHLPAALKSCRQ